MKNLSEFKKFAFHLATESAKVIKPYFRADIVVDSKSDSSPVTIADRKAEEVMREAISKEFPEHGIIGEEFGVTNSDAEYKWTLDPIDGTRSFISGALSFGTLIALVKDMQPLLGVINHPVLDEFLIGDNISTTINGNVTKFRECEDLSTATLLTTDHLAISKYHNGKAFDNLLAKINLYRNWGDCYGYYLLATGFADVMIDPIMSTWDKMGLIPIVKGANGIITDYKGKDAVAGNSIIAASKVIHAEIIKTLNDGDS